MPTRYKYQAISDDGQRHTGVVAAERDQQVLDDLVERNLTPISVEKTREVKSLSVWGFSKGAHYEQLIQFTSNLLTLYQAGIPLLRALSLIKVGRENSPFRRAVEQIRLRIQGGLSLSQALGEHEELFSKVFVAGVEAGEESGKLDLILEEMNITLEQEMELTRALKGGIRYPLIVMGAIAVAFLVLITFVVPRFVSFYDAFGADLPLPTRLLIGASQILSNYWPIMLGGVIVMFIGLRKAMMTPVSRQWIDRKFVQIPIFGNLIIKGNVARFAMMFGILFQSGLPIVKALDLLVDSVKNSAISAEIARLQDFLKSGRDNELTPKHFEFIPELALQMIMIGLESGSLTKMLKQVASHYSKEVKYTTSQMTAILEPILTLVMSVFVLIMALAIFLPMWNLIKVFNS
ncbi:MAG: type II secretion system F family protein [candidate division Zixibacteria bacterium]|nr:type II secretion system F family protein [candidate division Zixibacteria bacterium]